MEEKEKYILFAVAGVGVVAVLLARRAGSSAPVIIPASADSPANDSATSAIALAGLQLEGYKANLQSELSKRQIELENTLAGTQASIAREIGLAASTAGLEAERVRAAADTESARASRDVSLANINAQLQLATRQAQAQESTTAASLQAQLAAIQAQTAAAIQQAREAAAAELARAQMQTQAQQSVARAQQNSSIFNGIFSTVSSVLPAIFNRDSGPRESGLPQIRGVIDAGDYRTPVWNPSASGGGGGGIGGTIGGALRSIFG